MPLDGGGDRVVCAGLRRQGGGYTGNSFWLAERNGNWFVGTWGGLLYRISGSSRASQLAIAWLKRNSAEIDSDIPSEVKSQFNLIAADDDQLDAA
jgi:hypothetical protein